MTENQEERLVCAFESIAANLSGIGKTLELDYARRYPPRKEPSEPTITHQKADEELTRERLGDTGEKTTKEWLDIGVGPREAAFLEKEAANKK